MSNLSLKSFRFLSIVLYLILSCQFVSGQTVIFSDGGTYTNDNPNVCDSQWNSSTNSCDLCPSGNDDLMQITFGSFSIADCQSFKIEFDFNSDEWNGSGNLDVPSECGNCNGDPINPNSGCCDCWDFLFFQFYVDGTETYNFLLGEDGQTAIGGSVSQQFCTDGGSTASFTFSTQTWANGELIEFSNIVLTCFDPPADFEITATVDGNDYTESVSICNGQDLTLTSPLAGDWTSPQSVGVANNVDEINIPNSFIQDGTYTVSALDDNGCPTTATIDVNLGNVDLTNPGPITGCASDYVDFNLETNYNTSVSSTGTVTWYDGDPDSGGTLLPDATSTTLTNGMSLWVQVEEDGCTAAEQVTVTLTDGPTITPVPFTVCSDDASSYDLHAEQDANYSGGTITWHHGVPDGSNEINNPNPINLNNLTNGLYIQITNSDGCSSSEEVTYTINPAPTANNHTITGCSSALMNYSLSNDESTISTTGTVTWWVTNPLTPPASQITQTTNHDITVYTPSIWAQVEENGCFASVEVPITVNSGPSGCISTSESQVCEDECFDFTYNINGGTPPYTIGISATVLGFDIPFSSPAINGNETVTICVGNNNSGDFNIPSTFLSDGATIMINLNSITDDATCAGTLNPDPCEISLTYNDNPIIDNSIDIEACPNDLTSFDLDEFATDNGISNASIDWCFNSNTPIPDATEADLSGLNSVIAKASDGQCTTEETFDIFPLDIPDITAPDIEDCLANLQNYNLITFESNISTNGANLTWWDGEPNNGGSQISDPSDEDLTSLFDELWVQVESSDGCTNAVEVTVTETSSVTPTFDDFGLEYCSNFDVNIDFPTTSSNSIEGTWSPTSFNPSTDRPTINAIFTPSNNSCATIADITVTITEQITINIDDITDPICASQGTVQLNSNLASSSGSSTETITWSTSGDGTFDDVNITNPIYTFSTNDINNGAVTLSVSVDDTSEDVCPGWNDMVTITIQPVITPTFSDFLEYCTSQTNEVTIQPTTSTNGFTGTWSPATFTPSVEGASTLTATFTPDTDQCATPTTADITIVECNCDNPATLTFLAPATLSYCAIDVPLTTDIIVEYGGDVGTGDSVVFDNGGIGLLTNQTDIGSNQIRVTYTFPQADITNGTVTSLTLTATTGTPSSQDCNPVSLPLTFTFTPATVPEFTIPTDICSNDGTYSLDATSTNGITGTWSVNPIVAANGLTQTSTFTPNAGQCAKDTTITFSFQAPVDLTFDPIQDTICQDEAGFALPLTGTNGVTGTWSPTSTISTSDTGIDTYTFTANSGCYNPYEHTVEVKDCGCPNAAELTLDMPLNIVEMCPSDLSLDLSITIGGGATTALWTTSADGLLDVSTDQLSATYTPSDLDRAAGQIMITIITDDPDGNDLACSVASETVTVNFLDSSPLDFSITNSYCVNDTPAPLPVADANGITGTWSPNVISTSMSSTTTYTFTPTDGQGCYEPFYIDIEIMDCGCATPSSVMISTPNDGDTFCEDEIVDITAIFGEHNQLTTISHNGDGTLSNVNTDIPTRMTTATYAFGPTDITNGTVEFTATTDDPDGAAVECTAAVDMITINVQAIQEPTFTIDTDLCIGEAFTLPIQSDNQIDGTWSPNVVVNTSQAGTVDYEFTPTTFCADSTAITFTVEDCDGCVNPPTFEFSIPNNTSVCFGKTIEFYYNYTNTSAATDITITTSGNGAFDTSIIPDIRYTPSQEDADNGSVIFTATVADPDGTGPCEGLETTLTILITQVSQPPVIEDVSYCISSEAQPLTAIGENLRWYDSDMNLIFPAPPTPSTDVAGTTTYYVSQTNGELSNGCESERIALTVTVSDQVILNDFQELCPGESYIIGGVEFNASNPTGELTLPSLGGESCDTLVMVDVQILDLNVGFTTGVPCPSDAIGYIQINQIDGGTAPFTIEADGVTQTFTALDLPYRIDYPTNTAVIFTMTDDNGCEFSGSAQPIDATVNVPDVAIIPSLIDSNVYQLGVQTNGLDITNYDWSPAGILDCTDCPIVEATVTENDTLVSVDLTYGEGCTILKTIDLDYLIYENIFVPNIFAPKSGKENGVFYIQSPNANDKVVSLEIYDRWGSLVFKATDTPTNDPNYGWNGTFSSKDAEQGVYVYAVEVITEFNNTIKKVGDVTLIR